ncbi:MAG: FAD-dependent oxidoreductase [Thermofilum sp.]
MPYRRVVVIGAGVVGLSIARVLTRYEGLDVVVVEEEPDVGWGTSRVSLGIIYPGHGEDPEKHPLKAKLCREGSVLWRRWARELDVPARFPGELTVFFSEEERAEARKYLELATRNRIPGVVELSRDELRSLEPAVSGSALGAIYVPAAGVVSPFEALAALAENIVANGARLLLETTVEGVAVSGGKVKGVKTSRGFLDADIVVNAAGLHADRISRSAGAEPSLRIKSRKEVYLLFDGSVPAKPRMILRSAPSSGGVYVAATAYGALAVGPAAVTAGCEREDGLVALGFGTEMLRKIAAKLLGEAPPGAKLLQASVELEPEPAGGDWLVKAYEEPWGFVNAAVFGFPGFTGAPAIAYHVAGMLQEVFGIELREKLSWNPRRRGIVRVSGADADLVENLVKSNPGYGDLVCYCREVSKAEVIEALNRMRMIGVKTFSIEGVKLRTLAGFGQCQGSLCRWRIAAVIAEHLGIPLEEVRVGKGRYVLGDLKAMRRVLK